MTNEQTIILLKGIETVISQSICHVMERLDSLKVNSSEYARPLHFPLGYVSDLIKELKPPIKLCRCGKQISGDRNMCLECAGTLKKIREKREDGNV